MYEKLQKIKLVDGVLGIGILLIIVGLGMNFAAQQKNKETKVELIKATNKTATENVSQMPKEIIVDIEGEVIKPGVYKLNSGDRINEVLAMAGGLNAKADRDWIEKNLNKSELLKDGMKIFIPKIGEVLGKSQDIKNNFQTITNNQNSNKIININMADVAELDKLSGIGPAIAARIIDYREKNGGFKNIGEIKLVSGIGDKLFEKIKNEIGI